jgi:hypothetical protein
MGPHGQATSNLNFCREITSRSYTNTTVDSFRFFFHALKQHFKIKTSECQGIRGLAIFKYWEVSWICYPPTYRNWVQILRFWDFNSENWDGGHEQLILNGGRFKPGFLPKEIRSRQWLISFKNQLYPSIRLSRLRAQNFLCCKWDIKHSQYSFACPAKLWCVIKLTSES